MSGTCAENFANFLYNVAQQLVFCCFWLALGKFPVEIPKIIKTEVVGKEPFGDSLIKESKSDGWCLSRGHEPFLIPPSFLERARH